MKTILLACLLVCAFTATAQKEKVMQHSLWLLGAWEGQYKGEPFYEGWFKKNDSVLVNVGFEIKGKDTVTNLLGELTLQGKNFWYGGRRVRWQGTRSVQNELVLENDTLSYSNRIIWLHTDDDHWFTILQNPSDTHYYDIKRAPKWLPLLRRIEQKVKAKT